MHSKSIVEQAEKIAPYLPEGVSIWVIEYLHKYKCKLKVSKERSTRLGDYRHPFGEFGHRISINHDLNQFSFFITLLHEFAHLETWNNYKNNVLPHGNEWKNNYSKLLSEFIEKSVFPDDITIALKRQLSNPKATSCSDLQLMRVLTLYNKENKGVTVEKVALGSIFKTDKKRVFTKGERRKTRYVCIELSSGKSYLFHPLAMVTLMDEKLSSD